MSAPPKKAPLLTTEDIAEIFGIEPALVETLRKRHRWPHVKLSRVPLVIRYTHEHAEQIIAQFTVVEPAPLPVGRVAGQTARSAARSA